MLNRAQSVQSPMFSTQSLSTSKSVTMEKRCISPCFSLFLTLALVTHLVELILSALLAFTLYRDVTYRDVFFSLTVGFIILPLVIVQLVSAIFILRRRGDSMKGGEAVLMAVLHVLQLAFVWRHVTLLRKPLVLIHKNELRELFLLRLTYTFTGGFPLVLIQVHLLLTQVELGWSWVLYTSLLASALSCTWSVTSFPRSRHEEVDLADDVTLLSWPASLFTWLWRAGEMVSRMLCLALFASLYQQWVLLVLGLHWLVMLLCLSLPQTASSVTADTSPVHRVAFCLMTSYSYVWCYVSLSRTRTAVWYMMYYVIMFLENCTLSIVWLIKSEEDTFTSKYLLVVVSTLAYLVAMACLVVFYKHFHLLPLPASPTTLSSTTTSTTTPSTLREVKDGPGPCLSCHRGGKPSHRHPGWSSQYHTALNAGQYYKHTIQDSLLDSASDMTSVAPHKCRNHHHHHHHHKQGSVEEDEAGHSSRGRCGCACRGEGDGVSVVSCQTSRSANSCPHRRCVKASRSDMTDTTSVLTLASGASHNLGYEGSDDTQSNSVPAWLPSGESLIAKHLMASDPRPGTSSPSADKEWAIRQEKSMERYRCLLKQEAERWSSEGYTPHPSLLDWAKQPTPHWDPRPKDPHCRACCCCSHLSPGDSEVSSIFRAAHSDGCQDCEGCRGGSDVLYSARPIPHHHRHHPHHQHRQDVSSSESDEPCACCVHEERDEKRGKQYHSQPNVFTISQDQAGRVQDTLHDCKRCVSDSEGLTTKHGGVLKKTKQSDKKRQRDHSTGRTRKQRDVLVHSPTPDVHVSSKRLSDNQADRLGQAVDTHHIPSKLQVKAIAEKSDEDSSPSGSKPSTSSSGSDPIYENVSSPGHDIVPISSTSDHSPIDMKDTDSLETHTSNIPTKSRNREDFMSSVHKQLDSQDAVFHNETSQLKTHKNMLEKQKRERSKESVSRKPHRDTHKDTQDFNRETKTRMPHRDVHTDTQKEIVSRKTHRDTHDSQKETSSRKAYRDTHKDTHDTHKEIIPRNAHRDTRKDTHDIHKETTQRKPHRDTHITQDVHVKRKSGRSGDIPSSGGIRQEPWYICSESEDSALPPETFSSSVDDGFTATDLDSDGSFELII